MVEVELTEAGKAWLLKDCPQGIFYQILHRADGKPTIKKVTS